jgi:tetratricopeptide (TPR) repeat protein
MSNSARMMSSAGSSGNVRLEEALRLCEAEIRRRPRFAPAWTAKARALRALRRLGEALQSCDKAIELQPDDLEANLVRGNVLMELDRPEDALPSYERAVVLKPDLAEAHYNRANATARLGRQQDALQGYDRAIAIKPGFAEAHHARANALEKLGRLNEALEGFNRAAALKPELAEAYNNKGNILCRLGRHAAAVESYTRAVRARPGYALAWNNMASALKDMGRFEAALESCDRAIAIVPGFATAHHNRGNVLKALKRLPEAIRSFDRAIELAPDFAGAHRNRATTTLLMGDFERGWEYYECRETCAATRPEWGSRWTGNESLEGKSLLILAEQGFGDTIQFCRFAPLAAARGGKVTLAVQDPLVALLGCLRPEIAITALSAVVPSKFDYHIPLLSMPRVFHTHTDNIPANIPYLSADPGRIEAWKARMGMHGFRIGISWQGAVGGEIDIGRSFPVSHFETLAAIPRLRLISLQKNAGLEQLRDLPAGMNVETLGDELDPGTEAFFDTAAVMESLDLVITSDTAIAHLAGALGRPVWVALSHVPDWRWLLDRDSSPWYPTMKLFRQPRRNDWAGAFAAMKTSLLALFSANRSIP